MEALKRCRRLNSTRNNQTGGNGSAAPAAVAATPSAGADRMPVPARKQQERLKPVPSAATLNASLETSSGTRTRKTCGFFVPVVWGSQPCRPGSKAEYTASFCRSGSRLGMIRGRVDRAEYNTLTGNRPSRLLAESETRPPASQAGCRLTQSSRSTTPMIHLMPTVPTVPTAPPCAAPLHPAPATPCPATSPVPSTRSIPTPIGGRPEYQGWPIAPADSGANQPAHGITPMGENPVFVDQSGRGAAL